MTFHIPKISLTHTHTHTILLRGDTVRPIPQSSYNSIRKAERIDNKIRKKSKNNSFKKNDN